MNRCRNISKQSAFTLLELSIVLAVISLFIAGIVSIISQDTRRVQKTNVNQQLDTIEKALFNFARYNSRLPCPADSTTAITSSNFGVEAATAGTCTGGTPTSNFTDGSNTVGGVVPVKTLGLPDEAMFDPWGGRLVYIIDKRMTEASATTTYKVRNTTVGTMTIKDGSGGNRTTQAILVVMSYGQNGHGAYQLSGTRKSAGSTNSNEQINCHCDASASATAFSTTFVLRPVSASSSDSLDTFDDIVRYYRRANFFTVTDQVIPN